jgi:hypothetical protein
MILSRLFLDLLADFKYSLNVMRPINLMNIIKKENNSNGGGKTGLKKYSNTKKYR